MGLMLLVPAVDILNQSWRDRKFMEGYVPLAVVHHTSAESVHPVKV